MYDLPDFYLVANPIDRYSIGDRTPGLTYPEDGSLTIVMQHDAPTDDHDRANRLPLPDGAAELHGRGMVVPQHPGRSGAPLDSRLPVADRPRRHERMWMADTLLIEGERAGLVAAKCVMRGHGARITSVGRRAVVGLGAPLGQMSDGVGGERLVHAGDAAVHVWSNWSPIADSVRLDVIAERRC
jgi:Protein of unknown function (DUF1214)